MSIREEVVAADLSLVEGPDESWSLPEARPRAEPDRCALHEREQARAAAAEARVQELLNDIRRLRAALRKAGGGKGAREPLPRDVRRLHKALERSQRDKDTIKSLRTEVGGLRTEVRRLRRELQWSENHKETIRRLSRENIELRADLRRLRDQQDTVRSQSDRIWRLDLALDVSEARNGALKAKLATLLAEKKTLSKPIAGPQLRAALRRSWHQKKTIRSLSEENRRLRRAVRASEPLKAQAARHRAAREALSKALSGRTAELRVALRRSRRQKKTIKSLSKGVGRLRKALAARNEALAACHAQRPGTSIEARLATLRREQGGAVEGALRPQDASSSRSPRGAALGAASGASEPRAARRWPHPTARARGDEPNDTMPADERVWRAESPT